MQCSGETIINIFYVRADTVLSIVPWPSSNHDKALNYGCHRSSIRPGVRHPSCSGGGGSNPSRKLNIIVLVSELSGQAGFWRVRYKPADYLSLNTPALMAAAAGQGDTKLWTVGSLYTE